MKISKTKAAILEYQTTTTLLRRELAHEASNVHALFCEIMETSIRILEQTIHGSVSRNTKAKADYLATVAEGMMRKLQLQYHQILAQTRSPELQAALDDKVVELEREGLGLKRKVKEAEERLVEYKEARAVKGIAEEYAEVMAGIEKVKGDVERLERGSA